MQPALSYSQTVCAVCCTQKTFIDLCLKNRVLIIQDLMNVSSAAVLMLKDTI